MKKIEIKLPLPWLLSVVKNLKKVSNNIRVFEGYLSNQYDWNEAMDLAINRKYVDELQEELSQIINNNVEVEVKVKSEQTETSD